MYGRLVEGRRVLGVLRQPSWIGLTLLVVLFCVTFTELGLWQLRRHDERAARNQIMVANLQAAPVPVSDLLTGRELLSTGDEWRAVTVTGTYDQEHELLVRNRVDAGDLGYGVITPLVPLDGPALLVDRGWVPNAAEATTVPDVPPAPAGVVTVSARVRIAPTGGTDAAGLPENQVRRLDVSDIAGGFPYEVLAGGYAQLVPGSPGSDDGPGGPRALTVPEPSAGQHRGYAVQWFLFGVVAIGGWVALVRSAVQEEAGTRPSALGPAASAMVEPR